jgi:hypothetical protein
MHLVQASTLYAFGRRRFMLLGVDTFMLLGVDTFMLLGVDALCL